MRDLQEQSRTWWGVERADYFAGPSLPRQKNWLLTALRITSRIFFLLNFFSSTQLNLIQLFLE
jgi:hypothetical protein